MSIEVTFETDDGKHIRLQTTPDTYKEDLNKILDKGSEENKNTPKNPFHRNPDLWEVYNKVLFSELKKYVENPNKHLLHLEQNLGKVRRFCFYAEARQFGKARKEYDSMRKSLKSKIPSNLVPSPYLGDEIRFHGDNLQYPPINERPSFPYSNSNLNRFDAYLNNPKKD